MLLKMSKSLIVKISKKSCIKPTYRSDKALESLDAVIKERVGVSKNWEIRRPQVREKEN